MGKRDIPWSEARVQYLREHMDEIPLYLDMAYEDAAEDGNWGVFMSALRTAVEVNGGVGPLAEKLGCSRPSLYKTLSETGNPRLETLGPILRGLGLRVSFHVQPPESA